MNASKELNYNFQRYVGYEAYSKCLELYFSIETVKYISSQITKSLQGVGPNGRPIIIPDERIIEVMNDVFIGFRPATGDIFTRYNIPSDNSSSNMIASMINQTIQIIFSQTKNDFEQDRNNRSLSAWTQVYGTFNKHGLRQHSYIKLREKRPNTMMFNMNY